MSSFYRPPVSRRIRPTRRRSAWRALGPTLAVLALALAALLGAVVLTHHPRFAVKRVVLEGVPEARRAEAEEVTDAFLGRPLLFADLDAAVESLAKRPWVARVAARRLVPDTLVVRVEARPPVALARRGAELWVVDRGGSWLGPYAGRALSGEDDYPVISPPAGPAADDEAIRRGAAFLVALKSEDPALFARVSEVAVSPDALTVTDRVARASLLFSADPAETPRAAAAWRAWLALVPDLTRRGLPGNAADLRFEGRIVLNAPPELLGRGKT
ncbi:MAG TPA: FtsQ-type POTRA domain-containing protein [Thermoanaerobaculia bacterium]|nr:FtsQ-type POTRA domain-containing protein [Thermoanaerobaculia bacterium]